MNKFFALLKVNLLSIVRGKENKKKRKLSHGLILLIVGAIVCYYSYKLSSTLMKGFKVINSEYLLIPLFFAVTSIILIITNYKKIDGIFFKNKDFDILESLPIKRKYIILTKMIELYSSAMLVTLAFMIPSYVVYVKNISPDITFHIMYFISLLFVPCIPVVIATIIGYIISYISSFFKRKELVQLLASIGIFAAFYMLGYKMGSMNPDQFANFGKLILDFFNRYYPLTIFYKEMVIDSNIISLILYIVINIIFFIAITFVISKTYAYINGKLSQVKTSKNKKIKRLKKSGKTASLLKKDFRRLLSSPNYLLNSCFGIVILLIFDIGLIASESTFVTLFKELAKGGALFVFPLTMLIMMGYIHPVSVSLSLEGKSFYVLRTLPISFKDIIKEKLLFHLILVLPIAILTPLVISYRIEFGALTTILFVILFVMSAILTGLVDLLLDILFIKINWENEIKVIKRSIQSFLAMIFGMMIGIFGIGFSVSNNNDLIIFISILIVLAIIVFILLNIFGTKKFESTVN